MKRVLTIYPNCSLGGMTSVYTNRSRIDTTTQFDFVFFSDRGGRSAFENKDNVDYRIVRRHRLAEYYEKAIETIKYDEIRITAIPELTTLSLGDVSDTKLIYEFHTSNINNIEQELGQLAMSNISEIWVPSEYLKQIVDSLTVEKINIKVVPNIANTDVFKIVNSVAFEGKKLKISKDLIPIFWVGRLDKDKNYKDFFRALVHLPEQYVGILVLSLESEPVRISEALLESESYRITDRVKFLLNLSQEELADMYRSSYEQKGIFCSTSLAESFGYGVLEAALCGLPVVTYEVGGISEHLKFGFAMHTVNVGDTLELIEVIQNLNWAQDFEKNKIAMQNYLNEY